MQITPLCKVKKKKKKKGCCYWILNIKLGIIINKKEDKTDLVWTIKPESLNTNKYIHER